MWEILIFESEFLTSDCKNFIEPYILLGLGRAKAWPEIWPAGHGFWVARPGLDFGWTDPARMSKIAHLAKKLVKNQLK